MRKSIRTFEASTHRRRRHQAHSTPPTGPTTPTPDPTDDDDFASNDQQVYWAGGQHNSGKPLTLALGDGSMAGSQPGAKCYSALLGTSKENKLKSMATSTANADVMRQVARRYQSDGGGAPFDVFMLTMGSQAYSGGSKHKAWIINHLYFALLDEQQYNGLQTDGPAHANGFKQPGAWHRLLVVEQPNIDLGQGNAYGQVKAATKSLAGDPIQWLDLKVSLLGAVGTGTTSQTPICWSRTGETAETNTGPDWVTYEYGGGGGGGTAALQGTSSRNEANTAAFVVAWGRYKDLATGKLHWAISIPRGCNFVGVGDPYVGPRGGGMKVK